MSILITLIGVSFSLFAVLNFIFLQDVHSFNSYPRTVDALAIIALCLIYFYNYNESYNQTPWHRHSSNWIVSGLLIYFGSSIMHFAFLDLLYKHATLNVNYIFGDIHATLVMIMYLFIAIGFNYAKT